MLKEIESKAAFSAQQLQIVRGQIASKTREKRMLQLSSNEMDTLPKETPVYEGVGKMWGSLDLRCVALIDSCDRFVLTSTQELKEQQTKGSGDVDKELENLNKKLHYLETTYNNAQLHLDKIFKNTG